MRSQGNTHIRGLSRQKGGGAPRTSPRAVLALATVSLTLVLGVAGASAASKQVIAYFGTDGGAGSLGGQFENPDDIAVNASGIGPADIGDIYVADVGNQRIQRFAQDDNGTPADPYDDSYPFISAWGAGVESGGSNYQVCTVASTCRAGVASGGNGTAAGDGDLGRLAGIAVDQDSGNVYVSDNSNNRVNVYTGDGTFLRSFGWDVVESGPGNTGTAFEVCVAANGDVCKDGVAGSGVGQIESGNGIAVSPPDGNPTTGTVFLADVGSIRITTYNLDGGSPSSFGSTANFSTFISPSNIAVDSRGIVYASDWENGGEIERYDSQNANGGGIGFLTPIPVPPILSPNGDRTLGIKVDPDSDGTGPDEDVLYVLRSGEDNQVAGTTVIQQFGPLNKPGLAAPPVAADEMHGALAEFSLARGLGVDESSGRLFVSTLVNIGGPWVDGSQGPNGVYVLDNAGASATASLEALSDITANSVVLHGQITPNGPPDVGYRVEYSFDGSNWIADPGTNATVGSQETSQSVSSKLDPPGGGLEPNTLYHVRLVATRSFNPPVPSNELTFTTVPAQPLVETTGSPLRSTTAAQLLGRVDPSNSATTFHFEYGPDGPCDTNPCSATGPVSAGSGGEYRLAAAQISDLQSNTTYHYRMVADNGTPGSPVFGEDMIVTTRASDAALSHGHFPGPPGSDRAYEQVSLPDAGGNPVNAGVAFADNGERAVYETSGGNPSSPIGGFRSIFLGERSETAAHTGSWKAVSVMPAREELAGSNFNEPSGPSDLSSFNIANFAVAATQRDIWRFSPDAPAKKLFAPVAPQNNEWYVGSDDSTRVVARLSGGPIDPDYPAAGALPNLYDVSSGTPKLASLLPGNVVSSCPVVGLEETMGRNTRNWISADGKLLFFHSCSLLYMREFDAEETKPVSGPPLSGPQCPAVLIKSTPGAAFFWTQTRLTAEDTVSAGCTGESIDGDVYRYDTSSGAEDCVTCLVSGLDADAVSGALNSATGPPSATAVAENGSRVYFRSPNRLTAGAPSTGGLYRVDVADGDVRWIAGGSARAGDVPSEATAVTPDGSVIVFRAQDPGLNPLGDGSDNGASFQYYRYDDRDRSLVCVSCPPDGSAASRDVSIEMLSRFFEVGANTAPLADDGSFAFKTTEALVAADQNTTGVGQDPVSGTDLYEWRDGKLLLITDGLTDWPSSEPPTLNAISPSGRDVFFTVAAQYTPDALDAYNRLYDARIGGGFEFPPPPKPCPLEVCQGTPKGAPEEQPSGTANFSGPGNVQGATQAKKKSKKKAHKKKSHKRAHQKKRHNRANDDRRTAR